MSNTTTPQRPSFQRPLVRLMGFARDQRGASFIEYIIVVGLVAIIAIAAFGRFGRTAVRKIDEEERALNGLRPSP